LPAGSKNASLSNDNTVLIRCKSIQPDNAFKKGDGPIFQENRTVPFSSFSCFLKEKRPDPAAADLSQELALELKEHPQHLVDREDHLAVRNAEEQRLAHPLALFLQTLGMARGAKSSILQENVNIR
jgi:hypothetical protein